MSRGLTKNYYSKIYITKLIMKLKLILIFSAIFLSSCAYNYQLGIPENAPVTEYSTMYFDNTYKVNQIDGEKFSRKFSIWVGGSHTVKLKPGVHTFSLTYNNVNQYSGGIYTTEPSTITADMQAGKNYEIKGLFLGGRVSFYVTEKQSPEKTLNK